MKKIVVCLAIALTAMVMQAATATWGVLAVTPPPAITDLASITAYLVQDTESFAQADLIAGLEKDGVAALEGHTDASLELGVMGNYYGISNKQVSNNSWVVGETYSFYTVLIATDASDKSYYLISSKTFENVGVNSATDALDSKLNFGSQLNNTGWKPTPAPEPTSGLLLLVGGALLALRRKQK